MVNSFKTARTGLRNQSVRVQVMNRGEFTSQWQQFANNSFYKFGQSAYPIVCYEVRSLSFKRDDCQSLFKLLVGEYLHYDMHLRAFSQQHTFWWGYATFDSAPAGSVQRHACFGRSDLGPKLFKESRRLCHVGGFGCPLGAWKFYTLDPSHGTILRAGL